MYIVYSILQYGQHGSAIMISCTVLYEYGTILLYYTNYTIYNVYHTHGIYCIYIHAYYYYNTHGSMDTYMYYSYHAHTIPYHTIPYTILPYILYYTILYCILYTIWSILCILYYYYTYTITLYIRIVLYTTYYIHLHTIYYILYTIYYILYYTIYYILYTIYYILYTIYYILYTIYHTIYYPVSSKVLAPRYWLKFGMDSISRYNSQVATIKDSVLYYQHITVYSNLVYQYNVLLGIGNTISYSIYQRYRVYSIAVVVLQQQTNISLQK